MVSRPLCLNQASDRSVSSWVGDHQRIPIVVCFLFLPSGSPIFSLFNTIDAKGREFEVLMR